MVNAKILVHRWGPSRTANFDPVSQTNLTRSLLKYVTQAMQMVITNTEELLE